jgi:hypothetical protein
MSSHVSPAALTSSVNEGCCVRAMKAVGRALGTTVAATVAGTEGLIIGGGAALFATGLATDVISGVGKLLGAGVRTEALVQIGSAMTLGAYFGGMVENRKLCSIVAGIITAIAIGNGGLEVVYWGALVSTVIAAGIFGAKKAAETVSQKIAGDGIVANIAGKMGMVAGSIGAFALASIAQDPSNVPNFVSKWGEAAAGRVSLGAKVVIISTLGLAAIAALITATRKVKELLHREAPRPQEKVKSA